MVQGSEERDEKGAKERKEAERGGQGILRESLPNSETQEILKVTEKESS